MNPAARKALKYAKVVGGLPHEVAVGIASSVLPRLMPGDICFSMFLAVNGTLARVNVGAHTAAAMKNRFITSETSAVNLIPLQFFTAHQHLVDPQTIHVDNLQHEAAVANPLTDLALEVEGLVEKAAEGIHARNREVSMPKF